MKEENEILEFRLHGSNISPTSFKSKEVGLIITNIEEALRNFIIANNADIDETELFLSPIAIEDKSLHLKFSPNIQKYFVAAFLSVTSAIHSNDVSALPLKSISSLREVQKIVRAKNCIGDFIKSGETLASINSNTDIEVPSDIIESDTILYGIVQRTGGAKPRIWVKLEDNKRLSIEVTEQQAKQLGRKLYEEVGFKGTARFVNKNRNLLDFKVHEIIDNYEPSTITDTFKELRNIIGKYWDKENDINETLLK